ncbi:MAG: hypothetical protein ACLP8B_17760, partial [Xanthobacteraceae bacterium]
MISIILIQDDEYHLRAKVRNGNGPSKQGSKADVGPNRDTKGNPMPMIHFHYPEGMLSKARKKV